MRHYVAAKSLSELILTLQPLTTKTRITIVCFQGNQNCIQSVYMDSEIGFWDAEEFGVMSTGAFGGTSIACDVDLENAGGVI
jgi:hypothetical protein